ncbi:MAG: peptidoglycan bridge formation glycyltransferase FemA/FemB family protein, partial [Treponema sp.]|nr:peptidoglycan bridge formation glycyltransferase FemA/FemB family protein [Treponema sp.]
MPQDGRFLEKVEPADLAFCDQALTFLQSGFWGGFKARFEWKTWPFLVRWAVDAGESPEVGGSKTETPLLVMTRPLALGIAFAYVPWGPPLGPPPGSDALRTRALAELAGALRPHLPRNISFIRFDPPWHTQGPSVPAPVIGPPFVRAGSDIQAPDTVLVDLSPSPEKILAGMKPKWRYNIGLAAKKGVTVRCLRPPQKNAPNEATGGLGAALEQGLATFYALLRETALRDGIAVHGLDYYRGLFVQCAEYPAAGPAPVDIRLYLAEYREESAEPAPQCLAGIVTLFRGREGVYLYGASSNRYRNLMAPYALQWQAMRDAKAYGCVAYDLFGIPPSDDPQHPMAGLYRFKTGFIGDCEAGGDSGAGG